jgi:hypothetical protein
MGNAEKYAVMAICRDPDCGKVFEVRAARDKYHAREAVIGLKRLMKLPGPGLLGDIDRSLGVDAIIHCTKCGSGFARDDLLYFIRKVLPST